MSRHNDGWEPRTRLGRKVQNGDISSMEQALDSGLPLKEAEIVDQLLPGLEDEVLDINMVQRMTDSGRRVKFRCVVAVGNRDGYLGYAQARDDQVGGAIQKAIDVAKLNIIEVDRGSGSWEDQPGGTNSLTRKAEGKAGSVTVEIQPRPQARAGRGGDSPQHLGARRRRRRLDELRRQHPDDRQPREGDVQRLRERCAVPNAAACT